MAEDSEPPDLRELGDRLRQARGQGPDGQAAAAGGAPRGTGAAFRMATEMAAALLVGGLVGGFLDRWLGTRPWLLLVFLVLGMAAGILGAFREAKRQGAADPRLGGGS